MLQFEIFVVYLCAKISHFICADIDFSTMPRLNEQQRGEAIVFLLRGEDKISVPERFHVSQATLSRLRRRMLTTGSLNDNCRSARPRPRPRYPFISSQEPFPKRL
jgi:hypothetical protein